MLWCVTVIVHCTAATASVNGLLKYINYIAYLTGVYLYYYIKIAQKCVIYTLKYRHFSGKVAQPPPQIVPHVRRGGAPPPHTQLPLGAFGARTCPLHKFWLRHWSATWLTLPYPEERHRFWYNGA